MDADKAAGDAHRDPTEGLHAQGRYDIEPDDAAPHFGGCSQLNQGLGHAVVGQFQKARDKQ